MSAAYLAHAVSSALALATGYPVWGVADLFRNPQALQGFGVSLGATYLVWIGIVAALYLPCRWFADQKRRHPGGWMSFL